jgi:hypothetical protein
LNQEIELFPLTTLLKLKAFRTELLAPSLFLRLPAFTDSGTFATKRLRGVDPPDGSTKAAPRQMQPGCPQAL